ncbi:MAG: DUF2220 family protein [Clostridia bacterium]|nr:DUF2220 family protein [Clostridia bacterium]
MLYSTIKKVLKPYAGKRLSEKQIREMLQVADYEEYYELFQEMLQEGLLDPVKSSGSNGMNPALFKRYRVFKPDESYDNYIPEIRQLHSAFNIEGYLNHPKTYKEHKKWLTPINSWLIVNDEQLSIPVSVNERSFQIFHKEKALKDNTSLAVVLNFNPGIRELLNYYDTPEPFFTHNIIPSSKNWKAGEDKQVNGGRMVIEHVDQNVVNILISENKDTWYTLRKIMTQYKHYLFEIPFHVLMYGEGKKINRKYSTLTDYDDAAFSGYNTAYYYMGDIDYEGIYIFTDLVEQNPALDIKLMTPLYQRMLDKSKNQPLPVTKDKQFPRGMEQFLLHFKPDEQAAIRKLLDERLYIPQEILNYGDFLKIIEGSTK